jgi:uncharacterized protein YqgC (DUF456 family)
MNVLGVKPNSITMVSVMHACEDLLALEKVTEIHGFAIRNEYESIVVVVVGLWICMPNVGILILSTSIKEM